MFYYNLSQTKQRKTNCGTRQSFIICKTRPSNTGRIFSKIEYRLKSPHPAVGVVQILINITTKACEEQQSCDVVIITTVCPLSFQLESKKKPTRSILFAGVSFDWLVLMPSETQAALNLPTVGKAFHPVYTAALL